MTGIMCVYFCLVFSIVNTQRNGPLSARGKSFCENPLDAKRISFGIKYIALEEKNYFFLLNE